jgi:hypothetical protein
MNFWEKPIVGIYKITHRDTGKAYIGQSVDIFKRWKSHSNFAQAKKNWQIIKHALNKHGVAQFIFEVLEECSKEDLNDREIYWIKHFDTVSPAGYNLTSGGGGVQNPSKETRAKMSKAVSKPCIITIDGISKEYESIEAAGKIFGKNETTIGFYLRGERHWPAGWSGNYEGEAPNICTREKRGGNKKSKSFILNGVLYTCSQVEAVKNSGFPCSQDTLSRCLNGYANWPDGWSGHFDGEEPNICPKQIIPGRRKK